jgi:hypothetical protein
MTSTSARYGGGGSIFGGSSSLDEDEFLVYFSLFHQNNAPNGKDIYVSTNSFFFFSFLFLLFHYY